jgi:hypothetical protein
MSTKVLMIFPFVFYTFTIMSNTKNLITRGLKCFCGSPILIQVKVFKKCLQSKGGHFSGHGLFIMIYSRCSNS